MRAGSPAGTVLAGSRQKEEGRKLSDNAGQRVAGEEAKRLTPRQREIAGLIARGYTNAEIAATLVLTKGTVANHVEHILTRLGFGNRSQIAVWAAENGLLTRGSADGAS